MKGETLLWEPPLWCSPLLYSIHATARRWDTLWSLPSEAVEGRSHQEYLQPANLLPLKCWGTLSNYNCGEIFILSLTKMKHLFQKLRWHCASTREPKSSVWSQELLISFISGRSLMRSDREWENIPSLLKYKLSRFQFCCSTTQTGDQPGKTEEERTQPNACIQCSCVLMADWKDSVTSGGSLGNCSWISITREGATWKVTPPACSYQVWPKLQQSLAMKKEMGKVGGGKPYSHFSPQQDC